MALRSRAHHAVNPRAVERQIDGLLTGRNAEANRLASDLMSNAFEDMPPQYRGTVLAMANDFATIARRFFPGRPRRYPRLTSAGNPTSIALMNHLVQ